MPKIKYNYEDAKKIIYEDTNVSETNVLKDLFQICTKLVLLLALFYVFVYISLSVILGTLSLENQIRLENFLSGSIDQKVKVVDVDVKPLEQLRDKIKLNDPRFPKTSNLKIKVIDNGQLNAYCYPNGNIYITKKLYDGLKNEEMTTFVLAHEMAHYKHKDHLTSLKKGISKASLGILLAVILPNDKDVATIVTGTISLSDLNHSRSAESKADDFAAKTLLKMYGNIDGGVQLLELLDGGIFEMPESFSTHPRTQKRIRKLEKIRYQK